MTRLDDDARPLSVIFKRLFANHGPISLMHYMGESNARYYSSKDPLGSAGDFITAPEISQMFGELIGLWLADIWIRAGRPDNVHYVELGPGRGTLARDALRAMKRFGLEPGVHFVESSVALKGVPYRPVGAAALLRRNLLIYGLGGLVVPFIGIKVVDLAISALNLV